MKDTLQPGLEFDFQFKVTGDKTVAALYPESEEFQQMPGVFATGFMVGLFEWACVADVLEKLLWGQLCKWVRKAPVRGSTILRPV